MGQLAVDHISFGWAGRDLRLPRPNGAGKTTTINMLTGLPTEAGTILDRGIDCTRNPQGRPAPDRRRPARKHLYPIDGFENGASVGLYGMARQARQRAGTGAAYLVQSRQAADRKFAGYSRA